jgi:hypothetical protein
MREHLEVVEPSPETFASFRADAEAVISGAAAALPENVFAVAR